VLLVTFLETDFDMHRYLLCAQGVSLVTNFLNQF
jgi:hypothetical protein